MAILLADSGPDFLARGIPHELAHLFQFRWGAALAQAPRWFLEGDARALEPALFQAAALANARQIAHAGALPGLLTWQAEPLGGAALADLTDVGASFVLFLEATYGPAWRPAFYAAWHQSADFWRAFELSLGSSLLALEAAWRAWLLLG
ncbi:MAG: hypothetical protein HC915_18320 [Anaerolineae bacterium]|nr:hypothetical protein [Anaerolineae bacterium]